MVGSTILWQMGEVAEATLLDPHPGLVGWWRFDETNGGVAEDSSRYGNHGTVYGTTSVDGKYGKALSFDGVDDKVDCGSALSDSTIFTVTAWIKPATGFTGNQEILSRGPGANAGGWSLKIIAPATLVVGASFLDQWRNLAKLKVVVAGEWQMVAGVWDGTYFYLYANGNLVAQSTNLSAYTRELTTQKTWIGTWVGKYNFFDGIIDEARIYNRVLSASEIRTLSQKNPDSSSRLLAKVLKGTTQFIVTLSWPGRGSINVTVESPSKNYTEDTLPIYQKTSYASSTGDMLNIKRLTVSVSTLPSDQDWYIVLEFDDVEDYEITAEVER